MLDEVVAESSDPTGGGAPVTMLANDINTQNKMSIRDPTSNFLANFVILQVGIGMNPEKYVCAKLVKSQFVFLTGSVVPCNF